MSNVARAQQGLGSEQLRVNNKNEHLPTYDLHIGQSVMYLNPVNKRWYPATITSLCQEPRSYKIRTDDGIIYRKTQNHLKLYQRNEEEVNNCNTQRLKSELKQSNNNNKQFRPKCKVKQPVLAVVSVSCLGVKCLLHDKLMSTALTQLLIFRFSHLLTNKGICTVY